MRILVIKTSSLGDIVHTLPALSDAYQHYPELQIDWVVEESMQALPVCHPAVRKVIPIAQRRWRQQKLRTLLSGEWLDFLRELRQTHYDLIIDAQGLLKSVWVALCARGRRCGYDWQSARESWASLFYDQKITVSWDVHAVQRNRALFAACLEYDLPSTSPDYGLNITAPSCYSPVYQDQASSNKNPYIVFLHGTTWITKQWPLSHWRTLATQLCQQDYSIKLFWGTKEEKQRAEDIAKDIESAEVLPKQTLAGVIQILAQAAAVVSVDTGLGHLAAALKVPTLSLYGATDPLLTGTYGDYQKHLTVDKQTFACAPCFSKKCLYRKEGKILNSEAPLCLTNVTPEQVIEQLKLLLMTTSSNSYSHNTVCLSGAGE